MKFLSACICMYTVFSVIKHVRGLKYNSRTVIIRMCICAYVITLACICNYQSTDILTYITSIHTCVDMQT